ncbi:MAG: hypothetical protein ACYCXD_08930, partial [Coriobacteriia bacterium]
SAILLVILRRRVGPFDGRTLATTFLSVGAASGAGAALAWLTAHVMDPVLALPGGFLIQLTVAGVVGLIAAYGAMTALRVPGLAEVAAPIMRRLKRRGDTR